MHNLKKFWLFGASCFLSVSFATASPPFREIHQISKEKDNEIAMLAESTLRKEWSGYRPSDGTRTHIDPIKLEETFDKNNQDRNCYLVTLTNLSGGVRAILLVSTDVKTARILHATDFNRLSLDVKSVLNSLRKLEPQERLVKIESIEEVETNKEKIDALKLEGLKKLKLATLEELIDIKKKLLEPEATAIKK